jgi:hypothetical protein
MMIIIIIIGRCHNYEYLTSDVSIQTITIMSEAAVLSLLPEGGTVQEAASSRYVEKSIISRRRRRLNNCN